MRTILEKTRRKYQDSIERNNLAIEALKKVERVHRKDGGDFKRIEKNFTNAYLDGNGKWLNVCFRTLTHGIDTESISVIDWCNNNEPLTADEVEQGISKRITKLEQESKESQRLLDAMNKAFEKFMADYEDLLKNLCLELELDTYHIRLHTFKKLIKEATSEGYNIDLFNLKEVAKKARAEQKTEASVDFTEVEKLEELEEIPSLEEVAEEATEEVEAEQERKDKDMKTYRIVNNEQYNSIEVYFTEKPSVDIRKALKAFGAKWHHQKQCWYSRKLTAEDVKELVGDELVLIANDSTNNSVAVDELVNLATPCNTLQTLSTTR